jgi:hypothetical protein
MKDLLKKFENKEPVIVFNWKMPKQKLDCYQLSSWWCCRRWNQDEKGLDINEVLSLAKKQWKFTVSGPAIGGAKSGINFDPNDPRKKAFYNVGTKRYLHY